MADKKSEQFELKKSGAVAQKNSGRGRHNKGDGIMNKFCVDVKEYSESFSISRKVWAKICTDAIVSGNYSPALKLVLGPNDGRKIRVWVISDSDMQEYIELLEEKYEV